ncbi:hypothetical protein BY458DRAFT_521080 [Sporodiniella umbellata]|nr:hypothetical protein BY458DRAFT_521080 [Sporodiniella umbellata]
MSSELEIKISTIRARLNKWEKRFLEKHSRKPTQQDIRERPHIAAHYKEYSDIKKQYKKICEALSELRPSGSRILFPEASQHSSQPRLDRQYTEEEAFWLNLSPADLSQPSKESSQPTEPKKRKLILAVVDVGERKRKRLAGETAKPKRKTSKRPIDYILDTKEKEKPKKMEEIDEADYAEDSDEEDLPYEAVPFDPNQFSRHTTSVFEWQDTDFYIGCGKSELDTLVPSQRDTIISKIKAGTFGLPTEENDQLEKKAMEILEEYAKTNRIQIPRPETIESSLVPIEDKYLEEVEYKKKPIQKRRTRATKLKFVDQ